MKVAKSSFMVILFVSIGIAVVEIGLSIAGFPVSYSAMFQFDKQIGYRYQQGSHYLAIAGNVHEIEIDSDGVVDRYGKGNADILLLGDGVMAGLEQKSADRLAYLVGSCTGSTTVNLSVPGYGTVQQLMALENWVQKHGAPQKVFLIYNTTNDYFDNVQEFESDRIPGISADQGKHIYIPPNIPGWFGKLIRRFVWNSRLYSAADRWKNELFEYKEGFPTQQRWLFEETPPEASVRGDQATKLAVTGLKRLAEKNGFTIYLLLWRDITLENMERVSVRKLYRRLHNLFGFQINEPMIINALHSENSKAWDKAWIHPGTRHANSEAIHHVSRMLIDKSGNRTCR